MRLAINNGKANGRIINVKGTHLLIGRDPECQLRPLSDEVSRRHAKLKVVAGIPVIIDLSSTTGTRLNGQRLTSPATLRNGDRVEIGPLSFTILLEEAKRPKKPRRATEDEVASWLVDMEDDEPASSWVRQDVDRKDAVRAGTGSGGAASSPAGPPSRSSDEEAIELLKAMSIRSE